MYRHVLAVPLMQVFYCAAYLLLQIVQLFGALFKVE